MTGSSGILWEHVLVEQLVVHFFLRRSKTDSLGWGEWILLQAQGDSSLCPVALVNQLVFHRPQVDGQFFIHTNTLPLTQYQFNFVLRKCLRLLELSKYQFSSHSFRIGAASEAARMGLVVPAIKKLGRWRSDCFKVYERPNIWFFSGLSQCVWILGHSYIYWARKRVAQRNYSVNLECFTLYWRGIRGLQWFQLYFHLSRMYQVCPPPSILVIHLGGNHLGKVRTLELLFRIKQDLHRFKLTLPDTMIVFSEIISCLAWFSSSQEKWGRRSIERWLNICLWLGGCHIDILTWKGTSQISIGRIGYICHQNRTKSEIAAKTGGDYNAHKKKWIN